MNFCCHGAKNLFESRNSVGEFLISGIDPERGVLRFYYGFTACHRADWQDVIGICNKVSSLMKEAGVANFKLSTHHIVKFCATCGVDLSALYGKDGGALRDDEFLSQLKQ